MGGMEAPCPLCGETFEDDAGYAEHLADAHGLVDDDGAESTTLEHALVLSGIAADRALAEEAAAAKEASVAALEAEDAEAIHPSRIYDPTQDDHRFKPLVLGVAGLLLIAAVGGGIVATSGGDDDASEVAASETTLAGATASDALTTTTGPTAPVDPMAAPTDAALAADTTVVAVATTVPPPPPPPPPAPPTTTRPAVTVAPTTAPPPPPPPPPTTAPPPPPTTARPQYVAPTLSGARIEDCARRGADGTWTFSYVLGGGSAWAPGPGAQPVGGGRFQEARAGKRSSGFPASSIVVIDTTTGQARSITLSPQLQGAAC